MVVVASMSWTIPPPVFVPLSIILFWENPTLLSFNAKHVCTACSVLKGLVITDFCTAGVDLRVFQTKTKCFLPMLIRSAKQYRYFSTNTRRCYEARCSVLSFLYAVYRYVKVWSKTQDAASYIPGYFKFVSCDTSPKKG
jgi:hypothetical protein